MSKKNIFFGLGFLLIVIFLIIYYLFFINLNIKSTINIVDISLESTKIDYNNYTYMYGINKGDLQNLNGLKIKKLKINLDCKNLSYFQSLSDIRFKFAEQDNSKGVVIGSKPDIGPFRIDISPRKIRKNITVTVLVDSSHLNDADLLEECKNTSIVMTANVRGKTQTVSDAIYIHK